MGNVKKSNAVSYANDIEVVTRINLHDCQTCGIPYGLAAEFEQRRRDDHRNWFCPNGHSQWYPTPKVSDATKLEWAAAREQSLRDQLEATERARRAQKGQVTKIKRRIANGVCPCCRRSFADVQRHMAGQHPDFAPPVES